MMGEYILCKDGVIFGGIYDNRFLIKKTKSFESGGLKEQVPYPSAKAMFLVDSENPDEIKEWVSLIINDLNKLLVPTFKNRFHLRKTGFLYQNRYIKTSRRYANNTLCYSLFSYFL